MSLKRISIGGAVLLVVWVAVILGLHFGQKRHDQLNYSISRKFPPDTPFASGEIYATTLAAIMENELNGTFGWRPNDFPLWGMHVLPDNNANRQLGILMAVRETMRVFAWAYASPMGLFTVGSFFVQMATGILAGFLVGRRGWIERLPALAPRLPAAQWIALGVVLVAAASWWLVGGAAVADGSEDTAASFARTIGRAALMCFYAVTLVRLALAPATARFFRIFALPGRMPLTNYLLQTAMGLAIFYGWGLGLWGRTTPLEEMALAVGLYALVQLPLSALWLGRFRYGPIEYVWRRLTYGSLPRRALQRA